MEDLYSYLLIALLVAFGIYSERKKLKTKNSGDKHAMPTPAAQPINSNPTPKLKEKQTVANFKAQKEKERLLQERIDKEGGRSTTIKATQESTQTGVVEATANNDFSISSAEEARKAIIWSEILQRKY